MKRMPWSLVMDTPAGRLGIRVRDGAVTTVAWVTPRTSLRAPQDATARGVARELARYFDDGRYRFSVPVRPAGTDFQQRVWQALRAVAPGETRTYGDIARLLGSGARAVGNACRHNPISIIVPCHRIVASQGPGGYSGRTAGACLRRKCWLLAHERVAAGS